MLSSVCNDAPPELACPRANHTNTALCSVPVTSTSTREPAPEMIVALETRSSYRFAAGMGPVRERCGNEVRVGKYWWYGRQRLLLPFSDYECKNVK